MKTAVLFTETKLFGKPYWCINTPMAEYWYDPQGGGFARLIDSEGLDWISYVEGPPPLSYRGIPNLQIYRGGSFEGIFHPGYTTCKSNFKIHRDGHVSVNCVSVVRKEWTCRWDFYSDHAVCTILSGVEPGCAFLYEGTPGGDPFDGNQIYMLLPGGERWYFSNTANNKRCLPAELAPTRVAFGRDGVNRLLVYNYYGEKVGICQYSVYNALTVFGFGRESEPAISKFPAQCWIAFLPLNSTWESIKFSTKQEEA